MTNKNGSCSCKSTLGVKITRTNLGPIWLLLHCWAGLGGVFEIRVFNYIIALLKHARNQQIEYSASRGWVWCASTAGCHSGVSVVCQPCWLPRGHICIYTVGEPTCNAYTSTYTIMIAYDQATWIIIQPYDLIIYSNYQPP